MLFKLNRGKVMGKGWSELKGCSWVEFRYSFVLCTVLFLLASASDIFNCFFSSFHSLESQILEF